MGLLDREVWLRLLASPAIASQPDTHRRPSRGATVAAWAFVGMIVLAVLAAMLVVPVARANQLVTITIPDRQGEIPSKWLSYPGEPRADVLLPNDYDPRRRYPLLVALNCLNCNYAWYAENGLTAAFDRLGAIVVMPEGGSGWYTDWWNDGERGSPAWESYFLNEVMPTILARYRILPQRRYHAIAGVSMGGMGATYLGGRLPGFFGSVASLSGFDDPQYFAPITDPAMGLTSGAPLKGDYYLNPVEGPPNGFYMQGHNPTRLVTNVDQTRVFVSTGNGLNSPADGTVPGGVGNAEEAGVIRPTSDAYDAALKAAGIDITYQTHDGCHCWPDFQAELRSAIAWGPFQPVVEHPTSWVNDTVATHGQLWDIGYRFATHPNAVVRFTRMGSRLQISAAGTPVMLTTSGGCVLRVATPADVSVPWKTCASSRRRHHQEQRR